MRSSLPKTNESSFFSMQTIDAHISADSSCMTGYPYAYTVVESTEWSYFTDPKLIVHFPFASMKQVNEIRRALLVKTDCVAIDSAMVYVNTSSQHDDTIVHRLGLVPL